MSDPNEGKGAEYWEKAQANTTRRAEAQRERVRERLHSAQGRADAAEAEALLRRICDENDNHPLPDKHFDLQQRISDAHKWLDKKARP